MCGRQLGHAPPACIAMNTTQHTQFLSPVKLKRANIMSTASLITCHFLNHLAAEVPAHLKF
jgi:hypothetical protein